MVLSRSLPIGGWDRGIGGISADLLGSSGLEAVLGQIRHQRGLGDSTLPVATLDELAVLEEEDGRETVYLVLLHQLGIGVGLNLDNLRGGWLGVCC